MQAGLGTFLFFVLLKTGTSLFCEVCSGIGVSCTGTMELCLAGQDTCAIVVAENSLAGASLQTVVKACESSNVCNLGSVYMNFGQNKYIRSHTTCCVGDACRTTSPQIPLVVNEPNGKQCEGCYSYSPLGCKTETVKCVGDENYCLHLVEKVTYGKFDMRITMKGCVSENVCGAHKGQAISADFQAKITSALCTPALVAA